MLWEVEIRPAAGQLDREAGRVLDESRALGAGSIQSVRSARSFLIEGNLDSDGIERVARNLLVDTVVETYSVHELTAAERETSGENGMHLLNVLFKPGVTDNVAQSTKSAMGVLGMAVDAVASCRKYWFNPEASPADLQRVSSKVLANDAIEQVLPGELRLTSLAVGSLYEFELKHIPIRGMNDDELLELSRSGQLFLSLPEMQTIRQHFTDNGREPTDIELETIAQTWSEHCSHKTLAGRIHYRDDERDIRFENMLGEMIFAATTTIREQLGEDDWCVSVFRDNAGIVTFDDNQNVCFKVETHNHPSALEPYGGANTGIGGVIRDPLGTGLGARPVCNTDIFCFAPPDTSYDDLPPGVLHPRAVAKGVVAGVRDYGNRMGIPTVNGAVFFDERYLGNPLVYCGNVAMIPADKCEKRMQPGDLIVAVGGRTGRDGIHGATFSSAELTEQSETLSGGAVQIGNAITEKMMTDVILEARDGNLYSAITDCGAGGFSSAVGEMGEETGAEVWLEKAPLKYAGLSYTEIWISEAQERMVLAVPPENWEELRALCGAEGVEATVIGKFTDTKRLVLKYRDQLASLLERYQEYLSKNGRRLTRERLLIAEQVLDAATELDPEHLVKRFADQNVSLPTVMRSMHDLTEAGLIRKIELPDGREIYEHTEDTPPHEHIVGDLSMQFLHDGRPPVIRDATYTVTAEVSQTPPQKDRYDDDLHAILGSLNVCSKEWIIRQYDHEVQAGSVVKPLVGVAQNGPSDAAVVRPDLNSPRGLVVANGMNPRFGDLDPYWMAASAIDEAVRNCVAVGADPDRIAILDNFCWGNTERPETLGSLVRAALACHDVAIAYRTPFISGKDSLNNEFSYGDADGERQTVAIPPSLLISALGQLEDITRAVTMDLKQPGNLIYLIGTTKDELGGSHYFLVNGLSGGAVPRVDLRQAPRIFRAVQNAIQQRAIRSCHDLSEGGLAVAAAEMAFAGGLGIDLSLEPLCDQTGLNEATLLFSESNTRFLAEVEPDQQSTFEAALKGLPVVLLGQVTDTDRVQITANNDKTVIDVACSDLKATWQRPLAWD